jgi:hypothetical protein
VATRLAAGLTLLATAVGAVALTFTHLETICRSLAGVQLDLCRVAPVRQAEPPAPPPAPRQPVPAPDQAAAPAFRGRILVVAPDTPEGPSLAAQARRVLAEEGFALAPSAEAAELRAEIAPPVFGPPRAAPPGGPALVSVDAMIEARLLGPGAPGAAVQRREVTGLGATEEEARRDALRRAGDQIALRLAAALRLGGDAPSSPSR